MIISDRKNQAKQQQKPTEGNMPFIFDTSKEAMPLLLDATNQNQNETKVTFRGHGHKT